MKEFQHAIQRGLDVLPITDPHRAEKLLVADALLNLLEQGGEGLISCSAAIGTLWAVIDEHGLSRTK